MISTGGSHDEAQALMDTARAIEKKRAVLPTTERTNQILMMMFERRRGDAAAELKREAEARRKQLEEEEAAMKSGDVTQLLAKVRAKQDALKKDDDD